MTPEELIEDAKRYAGKDEYPGAVLIRELAAALKNAEQGIKVNYGLYKSAEADLKEAEGKLKDLRRQNRSANMFLRLEREAAKQNLERAEEAEQKLANERELADEWDRLAHRERARAQAAEQKIAAALALCDKHEKGATRWADPLPVPEWIPLIRAALSTPAQPQAEGE